MTDTLKENGDLEYLMFTGKSHSTERQKNSDEKDDSSNSSDGKL